MDLAAITGLTPSPIESASLNGLNGAATSGRQSQNAAAAKEFEAVFLSMLIKQMRDTLEEGIFSGDASDTYGGLFDMYMGEHLAAANPLGLATIIENQYMDADNAPANEGESANATTDLRA